MQGSCFQCTVSHCTTMLYKKVSDVKSKAELIVNSVALFHVLIFMLVTTKQFLKRVG